MLCIKVNKRHLLIHTKHVTPHLITHQINSQLNLFFFPLNPIYIQNCITFLPIYLLNEGDRTSEPADQGLQLLNWAESEPRSSHLYSQEITAELWLFEGFIGLHVISDSRFPHQKHWYADISQSTVMKIAWVHSKQSLVFGDEFVSHLKSHQRCSAGIRPVKFFHTDWIIISLWFLSYTQRHCHVRIEKSPNCWYTIRFPRISLFA